MMSCGICMLENPFRPFKFSGSDSMRTFRCAGQTAITVSPCLTLPRELIFQCQCLWGGAGEGGGGGGLFERGVIQD